MTSPPTALVVGDHFIPADFFVESLQQGVGDRVLVETVELTGSKEQQHADQQMMEVNGPNSVDLDDRILARMRASQFLCVHFAPVPSAALEGSAVKAVFVARTGVENVDVEAATRAGIPVFNVYGRNASAVAELAIGLMLAEARNIARADRSIKEGGWRKDYPMVPVEIGGATVGLVGFGAVGKELGRRLRCFDVRLLVFDPYVSEATIRDEGGEPTTLEHLFRQADFISLQARVTSETTEMIDESLLRLMKPTSYLINVGRSRLVKTSDLVSLLARGSIAGAGLDVYDEEPLPPNSELRRLDNVTLTTHFGGDTSTTNRRSARLVAEAMVSYLKGDLSRAVNAAALV